MHESVDVENGFRPYYVVPRDKAGRIRDLRAAVRDVPEILLATDPDREGESISWHLREVLKPTVPVRRIEFQEITEEAVRRVVHRHVGGVGRLAGDLQPRRDARHGLALVLLRFGAATLISHLHLLGFEEGAHDGFLAERHLEGVVLARPRSGEGRTR